MYAHCKYLIHKEEKVVRSFMRLLSACRSNESATPTNQFCSSCAFRCWWHPRGQWSPPLCCFPGHACRGTYTLIICHVLNLHILQFLYSVHIYSIFFWLSVSSMREDWVTNPDCLWQMGYNGGTPITEDFFSLYISGKFNTDIGEFLFPDWSIEERDKWLDEKEVLFRR